MLRRILEFRKSINCILKKVYRHNISCYIALQLKANKVLSSLHNSGNEGKNPPLKLIFITQSKARII